MADAALKIDENPMGTDGFEFVEYAAPNPQLIKDIFHHMGFTAIARHKSKNVTLYRQGSINFILNEEPHSFAAQFAQAHGPCACAMAFRVKDAPFAHHRALEFGAKSFESSIGPSELAIPGIYGIGDSALYFVDQYGSNTIYDVDFEPLPGVNQNPQGQGLKVIDHLTHNVYQGNLDKWAQYYEKIFNFHEQRYFNISGAKTGLLSRAMASPCGKIRIPINESKDDKSQIVEYLNEYKGEGIQHIALTTDDITTTISGIQSNGVSFLSVPETYYDVINERLAGHQLDLDKLKPHHILIDGEIDGNSRALLLQIFTEPVIGPIFFEIIQRLGHDGFGEGNFSALFESMERDQMRRGVL